MAEYVKYIGTSDRRVISEADWAKREIKAPTVEWNKGNQWIVDVSSLPASAKQVIEAESNLVTISKTATEVSRVAALKDSSLLRRSRKERLFVAGDSVPVEEVRGTTQTK